MNPKSGRALWIDYLRASVTLLVVAHHSALAYATFGHFNSEAYILSTHPIVDPQQSMVLDIFINFNDIFFMALMFLISGIFVVKGLERKGAARFVTDRFYRLFVPFMVTAGVLMMLAYFPSFRIAHPGKTITDFFIDYIRVEGWPAGPAWFIWVLFLFNLIVAGFGKWLLPLIARAGSFLQENMNRPAKLILGFVLVTWILYVPASWIWGPYTWASFGPFAFQKSRLLLYFGYFLIGCMIGTTDPGTGLFSRESRLVKNWPVWLLLCIIIFSSLTLLINWYGHNSGKPFFGVWPDKMIYSTLFVLSTCFSSLALLTGFRKMITRVNRVFDSLAVNAYGIYLVHYIFVIWCQYLLLPFNAPPWVKFSITCIAAIGISWGVVATLRKIPLIHKYV